MKHHKSMVIVLSAQSLEVLRRPCLAFLEAHSFCRCFAADFFCKRWENGTLEYLVTAAKENILLALAARLLNFDIF